MAGVAAGAKSFDDVLYDYGVWDAIGVRAVARMVPLFTDLFYAGQRYASRMIARGRKDIGDDPEFDELASMKITADAEAWWQGLSSRVRPKLFNIITEARTNGRGVEWVIREIETAGLFSGARASAIGVTETTRLFGAGAQAWMRHEKIGMWEWRTAEDGRVDPDCDSMAAGGPYPMFQDFIPAHVNCRCWPVPVAEA